MKKQKFLIPLLLMVVVAALVIQACGSIEPSQPPEQKVEAAISTPTAAATATTAPIKVAEVAPVETPVEAADVELEPAATVEEVELEEATEPTPVSSPSEPAVEAAVQKSESFTATTGLDEFSAYRMEFASEFEGTRQGKPTSGDMAGLLEATKKPEAQHLRIEMNGDTFSALAPLGAIEIYDVSNTFYLQNPQDGTWLGVPAILVDTMLPNGMYDPEESIDLPATAVPQPGTDAVNGVVTRRYTFGPADLAGDSSNYDEVEGTIWVAVDGNYVVKYEASFSGRHDNLTAGNITLLDEGTIAMRYQLSDVNSDLTIEPPSGALSVDLGKLLFQ